MSQVQCRFVRFGYVSMKSGLEDRNNVSAAVKTLRDEKVLVSMKSGLEDRNNFV